MGDDARPRRWRVPGRVLREARSAHARRDEAGTVILVGHSLDEIERGCNRALWMDRGQTLSCWTGTWARS